MDSYCLTLGLKTEIWQEELLNKRFEIGRKLYNAILSIAHRRYIELVKTKAYRENQRILSDYYKKDDKDSAKSYLKVRNDMLKDYRLTEYDLHNDVKLMQHHYKANIDSFTAQKIATRVWKSIESLLYGKGETVYYKKYGQLLSLEGKSNKSGIRYKLDDNTIEWLGLSISVKLDINNMYEVNSLRNKICYCRIVRKWIKTKYKYYIQLVLKGIKPIKENRVQGICGIDIGTQTIAIASEKEVRLIELSPNVSDMAKEERRIQRYMDRSRRAMNPDNFYEDGQVKKGEKLQWIKSKGYKRAEALLRHLRRKQKDIRKLDHYKLIKEIIMQSDICYIEDMNFKALQKRSKKTEKNDKGKFKRKKRFGKSLLNKAPSMFVTLLEQKLEGIGGKLYKVNTREVKASQYNHLNQEYNKKKLSKRWNVLEYKGRNIKIQRDLYSAFLIKNVMGDLSTIDNDKCVKEFDRFLKLHDKEIGNLDNINKSSAIKNII